MPAPLVDRQSNRTEQYSDGASLVRWLLRVGIEDGVCQTIRFFVMHGYKKLTGPDGMREKCGCHKPPALRFDEDAVVLVDAQRSGIGRIDLDKCVVGIKFSQHGRLSRARLRVPLRGRASTGEQQKRIP